MSLQVLSKLELPTVRNDILRRQGRHEDDAEGDGFEWEVGLGFTPDLLCIHCSVYFWPTLHTFGDVI